MSAVLDIDLIEQEACPVCHAAPQQHCHGQVNRGRIWPWCPGSAGPDWCHPARRQLAIDDGRIKEEITQRLRDNLAALDGRAVADLIAGTEVAQ